MTEDLPWVMDEGASQDPAGTGAGQEPPGLYVHVPFCKQKCAYCDFFSRTDLRKVHTWLESLLKEADLSKNLLPPFDTLYLGGGTPSVLNTPELERLLQGLSKAFDCASPREITIEANPDDLSAPRLAAYRSLGIDRISLGVQSLDDETLRLLGRRHSAKAALKAIEDLLEAGFSSVSVDLMYGIPGQTDHTWVDTLKKVVSLEPHHMSCYQLTLNNGTPLDGLVRQGALQLPDNDALAELFLLTSHTLESHGYIHYEVSNFALPGHASRHNSKYWSRTPYLGLGPAAHSFVPPLRWWNPKSIDTYCNKLSAGKHPYEEREALSREQARMEMLFLGLRSLEGVRLEDVLHSSTCEDVVAELEASGHVIRQSGRLVPTPKGYLVADSLPLRFLL